VTLRLRLFQILVSPHHNRLDVIHQAACDRRADIHAACETTAIQTLIHAD
jgi:hypothetical protein